MILSKSPSMKSQAYPTEAISPQSDGPGLLQAFADKILEKHKRKGEEAELQTPSCRTVAYKHILTAYEHISYQQVQKAVWPY